MTRAALTIFDAAARILASRPRAASPHNQSLSSTSTAPTSESDRSSSVWDSRLLVLIVVALLALGPLSYQALRPAQAFGATQPPTATAYRPANADPANDLRTLAHMDDWQTDGATLGRGPYWLRLELPAEIAREGEIVLQFENLYLDRVDVYTPSTGLNATTPPASTARTGQQIPITERSVRSHLPVVRVKLAPSDAPVLYVHSAGTIDVPSSAIVWRSLEDFRRYELRQVLALSLYFGLWFALLVYNAFVLAVLRDRVVLLYVGYLIAMGGLALIGTNFSAWVFTGPSGVAREVLIFVFLMGGCTALVQFSRGFLETARLTPRFDRVLRVLFWLNAVALLGTPLLATISFVEQIVPSFYLLAAATLLILLAAGIFLWTRRCRQAPLYVTAFACFVAGLVWMILAQLRYVPADDTNGAPFLIGSALELLLLAIAVPYRYRLMREEQEQLRANYTAQLEADVATRTRELLVANSDKDRLISLVAHDIRAPLATLKVVSQALARQPERRSSEEIRDDSLAIRQQCDALLTLVDNVLDWGRLRTGHLTRDPADLNVAGLVESVLEQLRPAAARKNLSLHSDVPAALEVRADGYSVQCVLRNLVANAVKFTTSGNIRIVARTAERRDRKEVEIRVEDSGVGIPADALSRLNSAVPPLSRPGTAGERGVGIGLSLCRELAEREGGSLRLESPIFAEPRAPGTAAILLLPTPS